MKRTYLSIAFAASAASTVSAFAPLAFARIGYMATSALRAAPEPNTRSEVDAPVLLKDEDTRTDGLSSQAPTEAPAQTNKQSMKKRPTRKHDVDGVLAPVVLLAKGALGDERLNKIRAKAISLHADVIKSFVDMTSSPAGETVLKTLYEAVDHNHNGKVEEEELARALRALGFDWLKDKQVHGIFERADTDHSGYIEYNEWLNEAPKTLRTNLVKLAKKNGGKLGLLA